MFCFSALSKPTDWVTAYNTSSTSLVVKWKHVPSRYFSGEPVGYKVYYMTPFNTVSPFVRVNYTTNNITLTNLRVYTRYYIAVASVSSGGEGFARTTFGTTGENRLLLLLFLSGLVNWFTFIRRGLPFIVPVLCEFCFQDNPCRRSPCHNNGTCQSSGDGMSCKCPEKFDGAFCESFVSGE